MKASVLLGIGKDVQDVVQAWIDPDMTKGKIMEMQELGINLWNLQARFPEIKDHVKEVVVWAMTGAQLETMREYFTADDWIEWDLPLFQ